MSTVVKYRVKYSAEHSSSLTFGYPVPNGARTADGFVWNWSGTALMGILNLTPDSFSDGGQFVQLDAALTQACTLIRDGAQVLDLGGESTRPGAEPVGAEAELERVLPVLRELRNSGVLLSIDTYKPEVAAEALKAGAHLINDVSGLRNPEMVQVCAAAGAPAVIMHMQGTPGTMQRNPHYDDVGLEVQTYLQTTAERALAVGVPSVMLDPGIGFGKTLEHNLALLKGLPELVALGYPVLLGASRKGLIQTLAGETPTPASERDPGSVALHLWGAASGAAMVRVHNVRAHLQALRVWEALCEREV